MTITSSLMAGQWPLANMVYSFRESDWQGRIIVLILFFGSMYVWTVMVAKWRELRAAQKNSAYFAQLFRKEGNPLNLFARHQRLPGSPVLTIYACGCQALQAEVAAFGDRTDDLFAVDLSGARKLTIDQFEGARGVVERHVAEEFLRLDRHMGILATAVNVSPFLGLLGTVWGVMSAFTSMAQVGTATLSAVAPGIAAALLTTVMALLVALPSAVGHNALESQIKEIKVFTRNFAEEFLDAVRTTHLKST